MSAVRSGDRLYAVRLLQRRVCKLEQVLRQAPSGVFATSKASSQKRCWQGRGQLVKLEQFSSKCDLPSLRGLSNIPREFRIFQIFSAMSLGRM